MIIRERYRILPESTRFEYQCLYFEADEQRLPQLELPREDEKFPTEDGDTFLGKSRFFDFSSADIMPLKEHHTLAERTDVCKPMLQMGSLEAYELRGEQTLLKIPSPVSQNSSRTQTDFSQ